MRPSFQPCDPRITTGEYTPDVMKLKLNSMTDEDCGFRHLVPCLEEDDEGNTGKFPFCS